MAARNRHAPYGLGQVRVKVQEKFPLLRVASDVFAGRREDLVLDGP